MFTKLKMHLFQNNINIINKCIHTFDISIIIINMILKLIVILFIPGFIHYLAIH